MAGHRLRGDLAGNLMADVGYRYLNFGDALTGSDVLGAMTFKNVAAHEVRVGLRWTCLRCAAAGLHAADSE